MVRIAVSVGESLCGNEIAAEFGYGLFEVAAAIVHVLALKAAWVFVHGQCPFVIGYRRVSSDRQGESGAGLAAQTAACEAAHTITEWHEDIETGSGRKPLTGRDRALQRAKETGLPIVVAKLDRLTRSVVDFYEINEQAKRNKHGLIVLDLSLDTRTPMGEAMAGMVAVFAQLERRRISERTREAMQALKEAGRTFGRAPVPQEAVQRVTDLLATQRPSEVWRIVQREGLPIGRSSVYALARR